MPPYQTKTSQATCSFIASSHDKAFVIRSTTTPNRAPVVVWIVCRADVDQTPHTSRKTRRTIFSSRLSGPMFLQLFCSQLGRFGSVTDFGRRQTIDHPGHRDHSSQAGQQRRPKPARPVNRDLCRLHGQICRDRIAGLTGDEHGAGHQVSVIDREHEVGPQERGCRTGPRLVDQRQTASDRKDDSSNSRRIRWNDAGQNQVRGDQRISRDPATYGRWPARK